MNDSQESPKQNQPPSLVTLLARDQKRTAYGLFIAGVVLAAVPLVLWITKRNEYLSVTVATFIFPLGVLALGVWQVLREPGKMVETDAARLLVLLGGALLGFGLLLVAGVLVFQWWSTFAGGIKAWQGPERWRLWVFLFIYLVGLFVLFTSVQLGRTEERSSPAIRRLLYGYNAVLMTLLIINILGLLNVFSYNYLPASDDWTSQNINSLSTKAEGILRGLDRTTRIYVIIPSAHEHALYNIRGLLDNCRELNDRITVEFLSPDIDRDRVIELVQKYKFGARDGILVTYGSEPNIEHQFIRTEALFTSEGMDPNQPPYFKGESELVNALGVLSQGKEKLIAYFTQGNGELDLNDSQVRDFDQGLGILRRRLESDNVVVKGLQFSTVEGRQNARPDLVIAKEVPKDAGMVIIAGPRQMLPPHAVEALRKYMQSTPAEKDKPKGKLFVLLDPSVGARGTVAERTGLEELLAEFGVRIGNNLVLRVGGPLMRGGADRILVETSRRPDVQARNPVTAAFENPMVLLAVRTVEPETRQRPEGATFQADSILLAPPSQDVWAESEVKTNLNQYLQNLLKPGNNQELKRKLSSEPLSIGVAVSETPPRTGPHDFGRTGEGKPRLVVIGDATMVCNRLTLEEIGGVNYDLFLSLVSWLQEKPSSIGIEPKKQNVFVVDNPTSINYGRMWLLPMLLMLTITIGLGVGVWIVRRR